MTTRNRTITVLLALALLMFLLACGAAPLTQEEAHRQCRADPQCHPAPDWVAREWEEERKREGK
jgi:hypothetical protein